MKKNICKISEFFLILNFFTAFLPAYSAEEILGAFKAKRKNSG